MHFLNTHQRSYDSSELWRKLQAVSALLFTYIYIAIIALFFSIIITLVDLAIIEDDDEFRYSVIMGCRAILISLLWPIALPIALIYTATRKIER